MELSLNEQNREWLKQQVESGKYASINEVMEEARHLIEEREQALAREMAEVTARLEIAAEQSRNGQYTVYTDETLHELFDRVKQKGRERLASESSNPDNL